LKGSHIAIIINYLQELIFQSLKNKQVSVPLEMIDNKTAIQVLNDNFNVLSRQIDKIENQIILIQLDNQYYQQLQNLQNTILEHLQNLCQKIQKITISCQSLQDQEFRNQNAQISNDTQKKELAFNEIGQSVIQDKEEESSNKHSDQNKGYTLQTTQNLNLKFQKSVSFQKNIEQKQIFEENIQSEENKGKIQMTQNFNDISLKSLLNNVQNKTKKAKSILKKYKTLDKFVTENNTANDQEILELNTTELDFLGIKKYGQIQNLIQKEKSDLNYDEKYFFSEQATKLSNSGKQQSRIICMTQKYFYVLPETMNENDTKSFFIKDINEIILAHDDQQNCSFKSQGTLQIENQKVILINSNFEKFEVQFLKKDNLIRSLMFQSLNYPNQIFNIQLQSDYDFPLLTIKLEFLKKSLEQIK
ncbi:hypothetical protein ABPG72_009477, partial [Tetrahymena utriculariae]